MEIPFSTSEFLITRSKTIPVEIADKLWKYHIIPMIPVRKSMQVAIWASKRSGYRPKWWEINKKRSGKSQHVYEMIGAVDWTCKDFTKKKEKFLSLIIEHTEYTRIAIYNGFIHCDYKPTPSGKREVYTSNKKSEWNLLNYVT